MTLTWKWDVDKKQGQNTSLLDYSAKDETFPLVINTLLEVLLCDIIAKFANLMVGTPSSLLTRLSNLIPLQLDCQEHKIVSA